MICAGRTRFSVRGLGCLCLGLGLLVAGPCCPVPAAEAVAPRPPRAAFEECSGRVGISFTSLPPVLDKRIEHVAPLWANFVAAAAVGDVNGDGWHDVLLVSSREGVPNRLYLNDQQGHFHDVAARAGIADLNETQAVCTEAIWFDYDNDGRLDLYVCRLGRDLLLRQNGDGTFSDVTRAAGLGRKVQNNICAITFDFDRDGHLDILTGGFFADDVNLFALTTTRILVNDNHRANNGGTLALYRNNGHGGFEEIAARAGLEDSGWTTALGHGDVDNDGWQDVYVANDFGPDRLFHNAGDGTFRDVTQSAIGPDGKKGMNAEFADYDNDGFLDVYVTNITEPWMKEGNMLWLNNRDLSFVDVARESGVADTGWGWGGKFLDFDNDGDQDLYVANGFISGGPDDYIEDVARWQTEFESRPEMELSDAMHWPAVRGKSFAGHERNCLFRNEGRHQFSRIGAASGVDHAGDGRGVALLDFDRNGKIDVLLTNCNGGPLLYRNCHTGEGAWIEFELTSAGDRRPAVGARAEVDCRGRRQIREVNGGNGYAAQSMSTVHFGLAEADRIDLLRIRWPNGRTQVLHDVGVNQVLRIVEPEDAP